MHQRKVKVRLHRIGVAYTDKRGAMLQLDNKEGKLTESSNSLFSQVSSGPDRYPSAGLELCHQ
ncbi:hypothetical protein TSUD_130660 [Trifolium subterraneum]|nr:hypothetical protein TSUD_130660 [Trifolium subterraneum]